MKKLLRILMMMLIVSGSMKAEDSTGRWFVEFGENTKWEAGNNTIYFTQYRLFASVGKSLTDKWNVGARGVIADIVNDSHSEYGLAGFAQYKFLKFNKFSLYGDADLGIRGGKYTERGTLKDIGYAFIKLGASIGLSYDITEALSLQARYLDFSVVSSKGKDRYVNAPICYEKLGFRADMALTTLYLGVRYTF